MNEIKSKYLIVIVSVILQFMGCERGEGGSYPVTYSNGNTSNNVTEFPSTVTMKLGQSVTLDDGMSTITFNAILEDTRVVVDGQVNGNAKIQLSLNTFGTPNTFADLNTNISPQSFDWENSENVSIELLSLTFEKNQYRISLKLNKFAYL